MHGEAAIKAREEAMHLAVARIEEIVHEHQARFKEGVKGQLRNLIKGKDSEAVVERLVANGLNIPALGQIRSIEMWKSTMAADASAAITEGKVTLEEWANEVRYGIYNTGIFQARNKINALQALDKVLVELGGTSVFDESAMPSTYQQSLEDIAAGEFTGQLETVETEAEREAREAQPGWAERWENWLWDK